MNDITTILPRDCLERLEVLYSPSQMNSFIQSFFTKRPTTIRTNALKSTPDETEQMLTMHSIPYHHVPWSAHAFILPDTRVRRLTELPAYTEGLFYIQSLSSMIPPLILSPAENDRVLDICAAPGSKTTQMAAMMNNTGLIISNDTSPIRRLKLQANIRMQGATHVTITSFPGQAIWQQYPEYFDKTLVDVPCSMEGRMNASESTSYANWSSKRIQALSHVQRWILRSAISATKPGGTIVYSTCTLAPEENEEVIDWILQKEARCIELEPITLHIPVDQPLTSWKHRTFDTKIARCVRIQPSNLYEGFFIAKLKKISSNVSTLQMTSH